MPNVDSLFDELDQEQKVNALFDELEAEDKAPQEYEAPAPISIEPPKYWESPEFWGYSPWGPPNPESVIPLLKAPISLPLEIAGGLIEKAVDLPSRISNRLRGATPDYGVGYVVPPSESPRPQIPSFPETGVKSVDIPSGVANAGIRLANEMLPPFAPPRTGMSPRRGTLFPPRV